MAVRVHRTIWAGESSPERLAARLWRGGRPTVLLQGHDGHDPCWEPRVALDPLVVARVESRSSRSVGAALRRLEDRVRERRSSGGTSDTGLAILLSYDWGVSRALGRDLRTPELPWLVAWEVDRAVRFDRDAPPELVQREVAGAPARPPVEPIAGSTETDSVPPPQPRRARTSLPRERYLRAVESVRAHIRSGEVYQGNLTQRFEIDEPGDAWHAYRRMVAVAPAPRAAFVSTGDLSVASVSPEHFLIVDRRGTVSTWPIKGTRARGRSPEEDRAAAAALLASDKDRAELVMIVDLERNDLGRVCDTGSVRVEPTISLRSFATVHHLVACVSGTLLAGTGWLDLLDATFPGGSVTGAPKRRAMEILSDLEPVPRGYFTGGLIWLGDDGSLDSSILIRTATFAAGRAWLGAGGGVVADSDPESEWQESNDKARAPASALGFDPEQAR